MIAQILIINIYMALNVLIIAQWEPLIIIIYVKIAILIVNVPTGQETYRDDILLALYFAT